MPSTVAYHLGQFGRNLRSETLREEESFYADETHFVIHLHGNRTVAKRGQDDVNYADVLSGDEGMDMMVLLGGGSREVMGISMIVFKNEHRSYPIKGVSDDVPGVSYRSGPKAGMDIPEFAQ